MNNTIDGREINDSISWKNIKVGDVVIEGKSSYRTITAVNGKNWEYFDNGFFHETTPEYCRYLVIGQAYTTDGYLLQIV